MAAQTFTADGQYLLNAAPGANGPDGMVLTITVTGTNSGVLKVNTAPPGSAVSLTSIAYLNASLAAQSAGTAITASGLAYISNANAALDLYLDLNWTSGSVVVDVATASIGGGGGSGGETPAADVTPGTFGANTGATGDYTFPDDVVVNDDADVVGDLTAGTIASDAGLTGLQLTVTGGASNAVAATVAGGSVTAANTTRTVNVTQTWNTTGVVDGLHAITITDTASGANSLVEKIYGGAAGTTLLRTLDKDGDEIVAGTLTQNGASASLTQSSTTADVAVGTGTGSGNSDLRVRGAAGTTRFLRLTTGASTARWDIAANSTAESGANAGSNFLISAYDDAGSAIDDVLTVVRAAAGALYTAAGRPVALGGAPGAATTATRMTKAVTAIADNTATTILTITVPNGQVSATVKLTAIGVMGAGGAIGAGEANASNSYDITVVRTAGVNAVADISAAYGVNAANVAGADTVTAAVTVAAVAGAVGATNTFPVQVTIVKSAGASANHTCVLRAEVINQSATGATVA